MRWRRAIKTARDRQAGGPTGSTETDGELIRKTEAVSKVTHFSKYNSVCAVWISKHH